MNYEQRRISVIPDRIRPVGNVPLTDADRRPMTSKQAKKQHLERNRGPRLTKQQQRERDRELQAEIRREIAEKEKAERQDRDRIRQQAKAKALRDKKKVKDDAEKDAKRKAGLPLASCRPSQDTIARFFRPKNRAEKEETSKHRHDEISKPVDESGPTQPSLMQDGGEKVDAQPVSVSPGAATLHDNTEAGHITESLCGVRTLHVIEEEVESLQEEAQHEESRDAGPRDKAPHEAPNSPPRKRIRLEEQVIESDRHQTISPPVIIRRTPSPEVKVSRRRHSPAGTPSDVKATMSPVAPLTNSRPVENSVPLVESAQSGGVVSPSTPVGRIVEPKAPTVRLPCQMNPHGFIRASTLHQTAQNAATPRFIRPQHPSTYKNRQAGSAARAPQFLQPAPAKTMCTPLPSPQPPSSTLAFITDNIDDFFGDFSQSAPEAPNNKQSEHNSDMPQTKKLLHNAKQRPRVLETEQPCKEVHSFHEVSPSLDLLPEFSDLASLLPSGTQLQRELSEDLSDYGTGVVNRGITPKDKDFQQNSKKIESFPRNEPRALGHRPLTLPEASTGDAMPFFCSQDFNLSPQDMQEIEASSAMSLRSKGHNTTIVNRTTPRPVVPQAGKAVMTKTAASTGRRPAAKETPPTEPTHWIKDSAKISSPRSTRRAKDYTMQNSDVQGLNRRKQSAAIRRPLITTTTNNDIALQSIKNTPEHLRPLPHAVSSQDLAAMMEADWDDDCLQTKQQQENQQQLPEIDEPGDVWDAISSQDLRAVFENWGDFAR